MNTGTMLQYTLVLNEEERTVLLDILEEVLKTTRVEEHRTDAFRAKGVVQARAVAIESLLQKARAAGTG
jgi:hypothetical protein